MTSVEALRRQNGRFAPYPCGVRAKVRELVTGGRTIETAHVYSPGLGWVVTHEDLTEEFVSGEEGSGSYDHHDAEGFIKLNALRLKTYAARNRRAAK